MNPILTELDSKGFYFTHDLTLNDFIFEMLKLGNPLETSLVGVFKNTGRGSSTSMELDWHQDGAYSKRKAEENGQSFDLWPDYIGLYCLKESLQTVTSIKNLDLTIQKDLILTNNSCLILDNNKFLHKRNSVIDFDRLLFRIWIRKHANPI